MGEGIVHELLTGSEWVNEKQERHLPYDITWEGVNIDVKTSLIPVGGRRSFSFQTKISPRYNGVVLVFLALGENESFFWTDKCHKGVKSNRHIRTSVLLEDLITSIKLSAAKDVPAITEEDSSSSTRQKMVNLDPRDHELLKSIACKLTEERRLLLKWPRAPEVTLRDAQSYVIERAANKLDIHIEE